VQSLRSIHFRSGPWVGQEEKSLFLDVFIRKVFNRKGLPDSALNCQTNLEKIKSPGLVLPGLYFFSLYFTNSVETDMPQDQDLFSRDNKLILFGLAHNCASFPRSWGLTVF
jgi:hypothetical protein